MKKLTSCLVVLIILAFAWTAHAQSFNCLDGFSSVASSACGVGVFANGEFQLNGSASGSLPGISGTKVNLLPTGASHAAMSVIYQTKVNVQAFTSTVLFTPNGQNVAWMVQNSNNNPYLNGPVFSNGAGCEASFFQGYGQSNPPNNVFALEFDSYSPFTNNVGFSYSNVQIYQSNLPASVHPNPYIQCPCIGGSTVCGDNTNPNVGNYQITKISTWPVPLNNPVGNQNTTTGDTYSATVSYDGSNFTLNLFDVTKGGSCPGTNCFTHTWPNVNIPQAVGGNAAWMGMTGATGIAGNSPLYISGLSYAAGSSGPTPIPPTPTATATATATATSTPTVTPTITATPTAVPTTRTGTFNGTFIQRPDGSITFSGTGALN